MFFFDYETRNFTVDLKSRGAWNYAHEGCEIILFAYAFDDGPVEIADYTSWPTMDSYYDHIRDVLLRARQTEGCKLVAHNAQFERWVTHGVLGLEIAVSEFIDTAVLCRAAGLPGSLEQAGDSLGLEGDQAKDKFGKTGINLFTKPQPRNRKQTYIYPDDRPVEWALFRKYCKQDVTVMRTIYRLLPDSVKSDTRERRVYEIDQTINDRGVRMDLQLVEAMQHVIDKEKEKLAAETYTITGGEVRTPTQTEALRTYINKHSELGLPDMTAARLARVKTDKVPEKIARLIEIRQNYSLSSLAKYKKAAEVTNRDTGRLHGSLVYYGAATGRWSARLYQLHNLPRPVYKPEELEQYINELKRGIRHAD